MKSLISMIGAGLCAMVFAACAADPSPEDDTVNEATLDATGGPRAVVPAIPSGATAVPAKALTPGGACTAYIQAGGGSCPVGFTCLWQESGRSGAIVVVSNGCFVPDLTLARCRTCTDGLHGNDGSFNDQMSSWRNRSGGQSCWWFDTGRSGTRIVMPDGAIHDTTSPANNDQASSFGSCNG